MIANNMHLARILRGGAAAAIAVAVGVASAPARAQDSATPSSAEEHTAGPSPADQTLAQSLFDQAVKLMEQGKFSEACPKLAESQRLDPGGGTLLNLGLCREKEGKLASAWEAYNEALSQAIKDGRKDREATARQRIGVIEGSLAKITVVVSPEAARTPGIDVRIDGTPLRQAAWGVLTPIDKGDHEIFATAPGKVEWKRTVHVSSGMTVRAAVPPLADAPVASRPGGHAARPSSSSRATMGWVVGGVGAAFVIAGGAMGGLAIDRRSQSNANCPNDQCTQKGVDLNEEAKTLAWLSDIGIGVGAAAVVTGVILVLTAPKKAAAVAAHVTPVVGPAGGGIALRAAF